MSADMNAGASRDHNRDVIAQYRNTKVAELTPPQATITRLLALLVAALTITIASTLSTSSTVTPRITATFSEALSIDYLVRAAPTQQQCKRVVDRFSAAVSAACVDCEISISCTRGDAYSQQIDSLSGDTLISMLPNGAAVYNTDNRELAVNLCASTAAVDGNITCTTAEELRGSSYRSLTITKNGWILFFCLAASLILIVTASLVRHKSLAPKDQAMTGHRQAAALVTWISDLLAVNIAWLSVSHGLWLSKPISQSQLLDITTAGVAFLLTAWLMVGVRHYARRRALYDELWECFSATALSGLIHIAIVATTGASDLRVVIVLWVAVLILLPTIRWLSRIVLDDLGLWRRPVVIVGTGDNACSAIKAVTDDFTLGYKVLAVADPAAEGELLSAIQIDTGLPVISVDEIETMSDKVQVLIALETLQSDEAQRIVHRLVASNRRVHMMPSLRGLPTMGMQVSHFFSHNTVMLTMRNNLARADFKIIKRGFDIIIATIGLLLLSPLFLVVSLKIMQDGGPAFFGHERIGKRGKPFKCLKFRSMHIDSQRMLRELLETDEVARLEWERDFKLKNDPRITEIGDFIRKTSIDELPQLINVLKGDMSIVGPRPIIEEELARYGDYSDFYLRVSPGITGLWQVSGRSDTSYDQRVGMDVWYTQNWSLIYDVAIIFKTVGVVFGRKGAY